jgi:hypothetical protein
MRLRNRAWSPTEDALLIRLYEEGLHFKQIGIRIGRSISSVRSRADRVIGNIPRLVFYHFDDAVLAKLYRSGYSYGEIATRCGTSRNSVAGRIRRLRRMGVDLPAHEKQVSLPGRRSKKRRDSLVEAPFKSIPLENARRDILTVRRDECRFMGSDIPKGDNDHKCCGHAVREGSLYCEAHHKIVYIQRVGVT